MTETEFTTAAERTIRRLERMDRSDAVVAACRGSANPAGLAWLCEALRLAPAMTVLDIGAGLGGPSAWIADRYRCVVLAADPSAVAVAGARRLFGVPAMVAGGGALPLRTGSADAALLLGVLSVVPDRLAVFAEAARVARSVGLLVYLSTDDQAVHAGGSTFPTRSTLLAELDATGWELDAGPETIVLPAPPTWEDDDTDEPAGDDGAERSEQEVVDAIEADRIVATVLTAADRREAG